MHRKPTDPTVELNAANLQSLMARGHRLRAEAFHSAPGNAARLAGRLARSLASGALALAGRYRAWRQRQLAVAELLALNDRILRDIGLSHGDVAHLVRLLRQGVPVDQIAVRAELVHLPRKRTQSVPPRKLAA